MAMTEVPHELTGTSSLDDVDLLEAMHRGDSVAWGKFYRRHVRYLYKILRRGRFGGALGEDAVEDLVQNTLLRAFEHAGTFRRSMCRNPEDPRAGVRAWLGRIAQNLVYDRYRAEGLEVAVPEPLELTATGCDPPGALESRALRAMRRALPRLSEREQEVLLATMEYRITGDEGSSLPPGVAKQLADQLGVTTTHLRQIRLRALRKLRTYFEEMLSQERDAK